jgi:hypothetical protein
MVAAGSLHGIILAGGVALLLAIVAIGIPGVLSYKLVDIMIAIPTIGVLMAGLLASFKEREFPVLRWVAVLVLCLLFFAQILDLLPGESKDAPTNVFQSNTSVSSELNAPWLLSGVKVLYAARWIINLSAKSMLCFIFLTLMFSWIHQKSEIADSTMESVEDDGETLVEPMDQPVRSEKLSLVVLDSSATDHRFQVELVTCLDYFNHS